MSIDLSSPTLDYISSRDISVAPSGAINFKIDFPSVNVSLSKVIMFEFKIQDINASVPNLTNTTFGFIAVENAIQVGDESNYIITVPTDSLTLDGVPEETIAVRVYYGDDASTDVVVSEWSNELNAYPPAVAPVIYTTPSFDGAYYDVEYGVVKLYVLLEESANNYDFDTIKFIVCFFYQNDNDETVWKVSAPTQALPTTFGDTAFRYIEVPLEGVVSENPLYNKVYTSLHAVYDWQVDNYSPLYHSVSFVSNEVEATSAADSGAPTITSVVYNVYTNTPEVPGNQTMTVNWEPPANSGVPFFAVDHYELYYALDGSSEFTLYDGDIPSTTLDLTVNVGSDYSGGLDLQCGQSIVFRVNSVDVRQDNTPSDPSSSTNIFKYAEAVNNLSISNATFDSFNNLVGFTVNFDGDVDVGEPNKGCGAGLQYVVEINGGIYSCTGSLVYVSGSTYSVTYSGLSIPQTGEVSVYLQTQNTNASPAGPQNGVSRTIPYIANNLTLDPVVYEVYITQVNTDQDMDLSWSDPTIDGWTLTGYTVQYSLGGLENWQTATTTNSQSYVFDASSFALTNPPTLINFRVLASLTNGSTSYVITSNVENKNTFKYAEDVQFSLVNYCVSNTSETAMTLDMQFNNPINDGINEGLVKFVVTVRDENNDPIETQDILYVSGQVIPYIVNFINIPYSREGTVSIQAFVEDSNSEQQITSPNYEQDPGYITSTVPLFTNVSATDTQITGNISTQTLLKPYGEVIVASLPGSELFAEGFSFLTTGGTEGVDISYVIQPDNTFLYTFTITDITFFGRLVSNFVVEAANEAGIGIHIGIVSA